MDPIAIRLDFAGKDTFRFSLDEMDLTPEVPDWARFSRVPCPGNHLHGPEIDYCRLSCQLQYIVNYFNDVRSFDKGMLTIYEGEDKETRIHADAQSLFFHIIFLQLSNTSCSVFIRNRHFRRHYRFSSAPRDIFYAYFSIFLVNSYLTGNECPVSLERLKGQFKLEISVLDSLIERLTIASHHPDAEASRNGLVIFEALLKLMDLNFEAYLKELRQQVEDDSRLS
ncbi:MAG: hypothetical protein C0613_01120 [Desulfobulbaceae bacterium]|nr:MAG: hypothetical protein C0613_01120 [Desulfobulbaceae bacterium]